MTPIRRVRRVLRWLEVSGPTPPACFKVHDYCDDSDCFFARCVKADELFAAEIEFCAQLAMRGIKLSNETMTGLLDERRVLLEENKKLRSVLIRFHGSIRRHEEAINELDHVEMYCDALGWSDETLKSYERELLGGEVE